MQIKLINPEFIEYTRTLVVYYESKPIALGEIVVTQDPIIPRINTNDDIDAKAEELALIEEPLKDIRAVVEYIKIDSECVKNRNHTMVIEKTI